MNHSRQQHLVRLRPRALFGAALLQLASAHALTAQAVAPAEVSGEIDEYVGIGSEDPNLIMPTQPIESVLGFAKPLLDTPRSVTVLSSDLIESLSIRNSEDIARLVPSTYSNFRFGLQGNVNVRNVTSDFYFRGMRRIDPQGNWRTLFAANDSIEIVRGLPSPIFGLGRIGGYMNFNPKTARLAKTGKYLTAPTGSAQLTLGSWDKRILTAEVGGPANVMGKQGGFHVFAYLENSGSYYSISPNDEHEVVQATLTLDLTEDWRLETGGVYQKSRGGLPGGINRTTAQFLNDGLYWNGSFSYQLDTDRNGTIGDQEMLNSYFGGRPQGLGRAGNSPGNIGPSDYYVGQINGPFYRRVPWQGGAVSGGTITLDQFNAGYVDATGARRTGYELMVFPSLANGTPNTAVAKQAYYLPHAFDLAPDTWEQVPFDYRKSFGEDYYEADVYTAFVDFVRDTNADFTIKAQFLADYHDQVKFGRNPFSQHQEVTTLEEKVTVSKNWDIPWEWLTATSFASANVHYYDGGRMTDLSSDIDFRRSLMTGFTPQDTFGSILEDNTWTGSQHSIAEDSTQTTYGLGLATDFSFFNKVDWFIGGRLDHVNAISFQPEGMFLRNGNGGVSVASRVAGEDTDYSVSTSLTFKLPYGIRPYVSYADNASLLVNASTGSISQGNVRNNMLARTELKEVGIKGSFLNDRLFVTTAAYEQSRNSFDPTDGDGGLSATLGQGIEFEVRWIMNRKLTLIGGGNWNKTEYLPGSSGSISVDARFLGYPDVVDATGKVIIPAEAFGWGGRLQTIIPEADREKYSEVEGFPHRVLNLTALYTLNDKWTLRWTAYHQGSYATDRLNTIIVPEATAHDAGITYTTGPWEARLNITNVFDKLYFNKGAFYWVSPRIPRAWEAALRYSF